MNPTNCKYTKEHEWVRLDGEVATVGITDYAQAELGDVVFVELPACGARVSQGESFGVVESVKAASDLYAPLTGEVLATNAALEDAPHLVNQEAFEGGWMLKVRPTNPAELENLLDAAGYAEFVHSLH